MMAAVSSPDAKRLPVNVLTGFLGSGKTTLLRHILSQAEFADTAVIINEFGEVGLDHLLVREVTEDVVMLGSGCICCSVRDDLVSTLATLHGLAQEGEIPRFARVAIETTGLAEPGPIAQAVLSERRLSQCYRLGRIITTVDATAGFRTLSNYRTAAQQIALADLLVTTKNDMTPAPAVDKLERELRALNPDAALLRSHLKQPPAPVDLFDDLHDPGILSSREAALPSAEHDHSISSFTIGFERSLEWSSFVEWLELLLAARGDQILRVKGLLATAGDPRPLVIQGVQHVVYPPHRLPAWPNGETRSCLVFIVEGLTRTSIERSASEFFGVGCTPQSDTAARRFTAE